MKMPPLAYILSCHTAFGYYKTEGIESVKKYFPECVEFVLKNKDLSLLEVREILTKKLDDLHKES